MADGNYLKDAIARGDFENARVLTTAFSEKVKRDLRCLRGDDRRAAFECGLQILNGALTAARLARSHVALRLNTIRGQRAYELANEPQSWSVEA